MPQTHDTETVNSNTTSTTTTLATLAEKSQRAKITNNCQMSDKRDKEKTKPAHN